MSVVYFKFRAQIAYDSILFDGHFISVGELKRLICQKKSIADVAELVLSDPKTKEEYKEDSAQLPKGTQVIVRRAPAQSQSRVLVGSTPLPQVAGAAALPIAPAAATVNGTSATTGDTAGAPGHDPFGADPFAQAQASLAEEQAAARNVAMVAGVSGEPHMGPGRGGPAGRGGWGAGGRGGGRNNRPPPTYHCRRCGEAGKHWEKDCPTVGDPAFDFKITRMPTGIPVTKLVRNADGALVLPSGETGELVQNTSTFQRRLAIMKGEAPPEPDEPQTLLQAALARNRQAGQQLALTAAPGSMTPPHGEPAAMQPHATPPHAGPAAAAETPPPQQAEASMDAAEAGSVELPAAVTNGTGQPQAGGALVKAMSPSGVAPVSPSPAVATSATPPAAPVAKPGLFDDDEPDHAAAPILLSSANAAAAPAVPEATTVPAVIVSGATQAGPTVSPTVSVATAPPMPEDQLKLIPPDLRQPFCSADDMWTYQTALQQVLPPRTTMTMAIELFGQGRPFSRDEFARFQKEHTRRSRSRSRERSRARSRSVRARGRSRSRSRSHVRASRRSERDRSREKSRDRSHSRRHRAGTRSPARGRHDSASGRTHRERSNAPEHMEATRRRERERDRDRDRDHERGRDRERERDKERERTRERHRVDERERERAYAKESARARDDERERVKEHGRGGEKKAEREQLAEDDGRRVVQVAKSPEATEAGRKRHRASNDDWSRGPAEDDSAEHGSSVRRAFYTTQDRLGAGHSGKTSVDARSHASRTKPCRQASCGFSVRLTAAAAVSGLHSTDGAKDAIASDDGDIESNKQHRSSKHRRHRSHKHRERDREHKKLKDPRQRASRSPKRDEREGKRSSDGAHEAHAERPRLTEKERQEKEAQLKARREARRDAPPAGRLLASAFRGI